MFAAGALAIVAVAVAEEEEHHAQRLAMHRQLRIDRKRLRDAFNPFDLDVEYFRKLYRMPQPIAIDLVDVLHDHLMQAGSSHIDPHIQVLAALRFFAEGGYQKGVGQDFNHPLSQSSVSRCIDDVVNALVHVADGYIEFPQTRQELRRVAQRFRQYIRITGIVGIVDCLLVSFVRPIENEEAFYNYKGYHAMNVQIICDADSIIRDIRICPGSNNDRNVWQFSDARKYLEGLRTDEEFTREEGKYYILGDSGYTPSPILLTPVRDPPADSPAARYNDEFVQTRCKIEQVFGILTAVWRCIKRERKLCYRDPVKVSQIIIACAVLHNFRKMHGILDNEELEVAAVYNDVDNDGAHINFDYPAGIAERDFVINRFYN